MNGETDGFDHFRGYVVLKKGDLDKPDQLAV